MNYPDDSEFMTPAEFAALPSRVHHAVWKAAEAGRVDSASPGKVPGSPRRFRRSQVLALAGDMKPVLPGHAAGSAP